MIDGVLPGIRLLLLNQIEVQFFADLFDNLVALGITCFLSHQELDVKALLF